MPGHTVYGQTEGRIMKDLVQIARGLTIRAERAEAKLRRLEGAVKRFKMPTGKSPVGECTFFNAEGGCKNQFCPFLEICNVLRE